MTLRELISNVDLNNNEIIITKTDLKPFDNEIIEVNHGEGFTMLSFQYGIIADYKNYNVLAIRQTEDGYLNIIISNTQKYL